MSVSNTNPSQTGGSSSRFSNSHLKPKFWHQDFTIQDLSASNLEGLGLEQARHVFLTRRLIIASILINLLGLSVPIAILQVYDRILPGFAYETLHTLCIGLLVIILIETLLRVSRSHLIGSGAAKFGHQSNLNAIENILKGNGGLASGDQASKVMERIEAINKLSDFYGGVSRLLLIDLPFAAIFLMFVGLIVGPLIIVPLMLIGVFGWLIWAQAKKMRATLEEKEIQVTRLYDFISEAMRGILTLKSAAMEPLISRRFESLGENSAQVNRQLIELTNRAQTLSALFGSAVTVTMVTFGMVVAVFSDITIGMLAAASQLSARAMQPVLRSASSWNDIQAAALALNESRELMHPPAVITAGTAQPADGPPKLSILHASTEENRTSIDIEPGTIVTFCGGDGTGKSSFLRDISGLFDVPWLEVEIDGLSPMDYRANGQQQVGYVTPQTSVLRGTILENLTLFDGGASVDVARNTCKMIGLRKTIDRLADGYATELGASVSETLPEGTIRQIILARAVAQSPRLLLLDEPQAYLDAGTNKQIVECLMQIKAFATIIMVTNHPEYLAISDHVYQVSKFSVDEVTPANPESSPVTVTEQGARAS
ncbi:MAG: ATP-binding cassette domain-containing protein [Pseudomonadota bacterium]